MMIECTQGFFKDPDDDALIMHPNASILVDGNASHMRIDYFYEGTLAYLWLDGDEAGYPICSGRHRLTLPMPVGKNIVKLSFRSTTSGPPISMLSDSLAASIPGLEAPHADQIKIMDISAVNGLDGVCALNDLEDELDAYLTVYPKDRPALKYCLNHLKRFRESLTYLREKSFEPGNCYEVGAFGFFTHLLERAYPYGNFCPVQGDIRARLPFADESLDSIICMEVFEHISEPRGDIRFQGIGVFLALMEMHRILKPGGKLFLTTPNAGSLAAINRIVYKRHPFLWPEHVREYTPREMRGLLTPFFKKVAVDTIEVTDTYKTYIAKEFVHDTSDMGENIFAFCEKRDCVMEPREAFRYVLAAIGANGGLPEDFDELVAPHLPGRRLG